MLASSQQPGCRASAEQSRAEQAILARAAQLGKGSGPLLRYHDLPGSVETAWDLIAREYSHFPKSELPRDPVDLKGENHATTISDDGLDTCSVVGVGRRVGGEGSVNASDSANNFKVGAAQL